MYVFMCNKPLSDGSTSVADLEIVKGGSTSGTQSMLENCCGATPTSGHMRTNMTTMLHTALFG